MSAGSQHLLQLVVHELNLGANDDLNRSLRRAHYACNACGYHDTEWTTVSGRGVLRSVITPVALNANNTLAAIGPYCFGEVELEEGCSFNSTIFGVDAKNAKKIRGKLPVPVHPKFIQMDGYTTLMFEVDEEALAD